MAVKYPRGYGYTVGTLDQTMAELRAHGHPVFVASIEQFLLNQNGRVGIGDAWRATGTQPNRPGFAPEGRSFHQNQRFRSGFVGCTAVDLVVIRDGAAHRSPMWKEVPKSGSADAKRYGLHCNISTEPWHMQPHNIFGWQTWTDNGRPDPIAGTLAPKPPTPTPNPKPPTGDLIKDAPPATPFPLKIGAPPDLARVRWLQQILNERFGGNLGVDGGFGQKTHDAVIAMQRTLGVGADGVYGQQTATALAAWLAAH